MGCVTAVNEVCKDNVTRTPCHECSRVKVGIVCPFSWSYLGGVGEHADGQAEALEALGVKAKVISGDDPPGSVSRLFHPDAARADARPPWVIPVGTTVTVPAN